MATYLTPSGVWKSVRKILSGDKVGPSESGGVSNDPHQDLTDRTEYLKGSVDAHAAAAAPHSGHATVTALNSHITNHSNPHAVTTTQIGAETPSGAQAKVNAAAIGVGQSWQTVARSKNVIYQATSRTIELAFRVESYYGQGMTLQVGDSVANLGDVDLAWSTDNNRPDRKFLKATVPPNHYYKINAPSDGGVYTVVSCKELR